MLDRQQERRQWQGQDGAAVCTRRPLEAGTGGEDLGEEKEELWEGLAGVGGGGLFRQRGEHRGDPTSVGKQAEVFRKESTCQTWALRGQESCSQPQSQPWRAPENGPFSRRPPRGMMWVTPSPQSPETTSLLCILGVATIGSVHSLRGWIAHQQSNSLSNPILEYEAFSFNNSHDDDSSHLPLAGM